MTFLEQLDQLDRSIFLEINGWWASFLDLPMWLISYPLFWLPLYVVFILYARKKHGDKGILWLLIGIGLVVLLADNIHRECFKEVFERLRPSRNPELEGLIHSVLPPGKEEVYRGGLYGFISGHAANFTGISIFVLKFLELNKKWTVLILFWAALICYSRIYLGVHYPGDILGGICLGLAAGFLAHFLVNRYLVKRSIT